MKNAKHVVAVMVVATALCADRAAASAPASSHRPVAVRDLARQLATRLTVNLRQAIPAVRHFSAQVAFVRPCDVRPVDAETLVAHRWSLSPFEFRLPPPVKA